MVIPLFFFVLAIMALLLIYKIAARFQLRWGIKTSGFIWLQILCFVGRGFLLYWGRSFCKVSNISIEHFEGRFISLLLFRCLGFLRQLIDLKGVLKDLSWRA